MSSSSIFFAPGWLIVSNPNRHPSLCSCLLSSLRSDDVAVAIDGAHVHRPAGDQLHAAVCAVVHQGLVPLHAALGPAAQCFRCSLHGPGR